ncbi:hypothetical protein BDR07DRAFT_1409170 [Suillus spraguei]|nr:hypothetical protein BDR07DRAFT_1409170 [Suillus spraguei]
MSLSCSTCTTTHIISFLAAITPRMSTTILTAPLAAASSQNVTLPPIPELINPNFLDVLLPVSEDASPTTVTENSPAHSNAMMDAHGSCIPDPKTAALLNTANDDFASC